MRDIMNTDFGVICAFCSFIFGIIVFPFKVYKVYKQSKSFLSKENNKHLIRDILISALFTVFGLIIPILVIYGTWPWPFSFLWLVLQILAWYSIVSYVGLVWMIWSVLRILKKEGL